MIAYDKTLEAARAAGYKATWIDDDCVVLMDRENHENWIQVSYDNYSPTLKFINAIHADGREFKGYPAVRKAL